MEKKFKRIMWGIAIAVFLIVQVIGLCFGRVIEGSLFAEVAKWVVMGAVIAGVVCGLAWIPVSIYLQRHKDAD